MFIDTIYYLRVFHESIKEGLLERDHLLAEKWCEHTVYPC